MKIIVAQVGARHNYAIPRMLNSKAALVALYTDSCANAGLGRIMDRAIPPALRSKGALKRLLDRRVTGVPHEKIFVSDRTLLENLLGHRSRTAFDGYARASDNLSAAMTRWGTQDADLVYSMFGEGLAFLRRAKAEGRRVGIDVHITPIAHRIVAEERARFPGWEEADPDELDPHVVEDEVRRILDVADVITCPGRNVVNGLRDYLGDYDSRIRVVPYGCGYEYGDRINRPVKGRILFAGSAHLRKGIHYLAQAASLLRRNGVDFSVRIAGEATERVRTRAECASLTFLGRLPRTAMIEEFMAADVLVLPTLAEGSASVIYEAMAAGIPVITTSSAGSIVRDGIDGYIIAERDVEGLASAMAHVISDRTVRAKMADAARMRVADFTESLWADRLLGALA